MFKIVVKLKSRHHRRAAILLVHFLSSCSYFRRDGVERFNFQPV